MEITYKEETLDQFKSRIKNQNSFNCKNYNDSNINIISIYPRYNKNENPGNQWEIFLEEFLLSFFENYTVILEMGTSCSGEVHEKFENNENILCYIDAQFYNNIYIYVRTFERTLLRELIFFEHYWAQNDFRFYIYSKEYQFNNLTFEELTKNNIVNKNFLSEIQLTGDGETLICILQLNNIANSDALISFTPQYDSMVQTHS